MTQERVRRLLWERKKSPFENRDHELGTEIRVVQADDLLRFEVHQETMPLLAKRSRRDYVLFRLTADELRTILEAVE